MGVLLDELRQAVRRLRRHWGFSLTFIVTLALAVGANGGVFAAVSAYLFQPLPFAHPDQLVVVRLYAAKIDMTMNPPYLDFSKVTDIASGGRLQRNVSTVEIHGTPRSVHAASASPSLFPTLGVRPFLGRWLDAHASDPGAVKEVVLSYAFWQSALQADPKILGQPLRIDGRTYRIVGVMPRGFYFPERNVAFWKALPASELQTPEAGMAIARTAPGISLAQARVALKTRGEQVFEAGPEWRREMEPRIIATPLRKFLGKDKLDQLLLMQAGALALLLLAAANLGNLALVRAVRRRHEFALRVALGARRRALVRLAIAESLPLGLVAAGFGLLLAKYAAAVLATFGIADQLTAFRIGFTAPVVSVILALALAIALLAMSVPLLMVRRERLEGVLKQAGEHSGGSRNALRVRRSLSTLQIALAVLLLSGAALIGLSLRMMVAHDPGFNAKNLVVAHLSLNGPKYKSHQQITRAWQSVRQAAESLPSVQAAGLGYGVPFTGWSMLMNFPLPNATASQPNITTGGFIADSSVLQALGVRLLAGRFFNSTDIKNGANVAIVDARLARALYGTTDVIGRTLDGKSDGKRIVGVIGAINDEFSASGKGKAIYPIIRSPTGAAPPMMDLVVRSALPPATVAKELRAMLRKIMPDQSFSKIAPMQRYIDQAAQDTSALAILLIACGIVALALASIGTYGVIAQLGRARRREFAVRIALGAHPGHVEGLVVRSGLLLWLVGSLAGVGVAIWMGLIFSDRLYEVSVFTPTPYIAAAGLIGAIVLLASWLPARAVRRLDLSNALHEE